MTSNTRRHSSNTATSIRTMMSGTRRAGHSSGTTAIPSWSGVSRSGSLQGESRARVGGHWAQKGRPWGRGSSGERYGRRYRLTYETFACGFVGLHSSEALGNHLLHMNAMDICYGRWLWRTGRLSPCDCTCGRVSLVGSAKLESRLLRTSDAAWHIVITLVSGY